MWKILSFKANSNTHTFQYCPTAALAKAKIIVLHLKLRTIPCKAYLTGHKLGTKLLVII